jgi:hypothetical protein
MHAHLWVLITDEMGDTTEALSPIGLLHQPMWETSHGAQDWRTHIPVELRNLWAELELDARAALMYLAMRVARRAATEP